MYMYLEDAFIFTLGRPRPNYIERWTTLGQGKSGATYFDRTHHTVFSSRPVER